MKKTLLTFIIIFTLLTLTFTLVPETKSQTQSVKVVSYTYYIDSIGYLVVVGEVQNQGPNTISGVTVTGVVTSSDESQANSYAQVWGQYLLPQQKAPFYMEFTSESSSGGTWNTDISDVALTVYQADATANYQYPDLTITNQQSYVGTNKVGDLSDYGVFWVTGSIQNTGSQTAQNVTLVATFYNSQNQVVAAGYSDKTTMNPYSIDPQQSSTFKLGAFDLNQTIVPADKKIVTYSLLVQVQGPILQGTAPVPVATSTPPPVSSTTPAPTNSQVGTSGNDSTGAPIPSVVYIIVAVAIAIVVAAGLLLFRKPSRTKQIANQNKNRPNKTKKPKK